MLLLMLILMLMVLRLDGLLPRGVLPCLAPRRVLFLFVRSRALLVALAGVVLGRVRGRFALRLGSLLLAEGAEGILILLLISFLLLLGDL